jgi:biopolymer transport protein ExbD
MKRFSQRGGHSAMTELNVTPLLDLAFVLLIIFMITTPLLEQSIDVTLPVASASTSTVDPSAVKTITVNKQGLIAVEKNIVSLRQLDATLERWKQADPNVAVVIRADRAIEYQKLVDVFDALTRARIARMGLLNNPDK